MKKQLISGLLASATVVGICLAAAPAANAAPVAGGSTDGSVGFTGHVPPTTPSGGDLDLLWVPGSFEFGNANTNSTAAKTYNATNGATKYAVVKDERNTNGTAGTPNEWKLTAKATKLQDGSDALTGAQYKFSGNVLKSYVSASGQDTEVPESAGAISATLPAGTTTTAVANVVLPADGTTEVKVMEAADPAVDGKYAAELNSIQLSVPANTSKDGKQYTGTIAWSLDDAI